jgi:regulatory protein
MNPQRGSARDLAYRLLARRSHTSAELYHKLGRKGFPRDEIARVIEEFSSKGYLNDEETALRWAQNLVRAKQWGRLKVAAYLARKGLDREMVERVQQHIWEEFNEEAVAREAFRKRFPLWHDKPSPSRAALFLKSCGFSTGGIYAVVGTCTENDADPS